MLLIILLKRAPYNDATVWYDSQAYKASIMPKL